MNNKLLNLNQLSKTRKNTDDEEIFEKVIFPSYIDMYEKTGKVPRAEKLSEEIKYKVSVNAYDVIYNRPESYYNPLKLAEILMEEKCVIEYSGKILGRAIKPIFKCNIENKILGLNP